jgi:hypothetical protein
MVPLSFLISTWAYKWIGLPRIRTAGADFPTLSRSIRHFGKTPIPPLQQVWQRSLLTRCAIIQKMITSIGAMQIFTRPTARSRATNMIAYQRFFRALAGAVVLLCTPRAFLAQTVLLSGNEFRQIAEAAVSYMEALNANRGTAPPKSLQTHFATARSRQAFRDHLALSARSFTPVISGVTEVSSGDELVRDCDGLVASDCAALRGKRYIWISPSTVTASSVRVWVHSSQTRPYLHRPKSMSDTTRRSQTHYLLDAEATEIELTRDNRGRWSFLRVISWIG